MLTYWSQWEAARYCMLSRLRTPFGGPQQTFDSLEKQLNALLQQDQIPAMNDNLRLVIGLILSKTNLLRHYDRLARLTFYLQTIG